jgi:hypothetical protein
MRVCEGPGSGGATYGLPSGPSTGVSVCWMLAGAVDRGSAGAGGEVGAGVIGEIGAGSVWAGGA